MKQITFLFVLVLLPMMASADEYGTCGTNVSYSYDSSTGTLTISGTGTMADYTWNNPAPWYDYREEMVKVIIEDGVTSIGKLAFCGYICLNSITIPNSVTSIGRNAFYNCSGLKTFFSEITKPFEIGDIGTTTVILIVPVGTKAAYQSTAGWSSFTNIFEVGEGGAVGLTFENDVFSYTICENNKVSVTSVNKPISGAIVIPSQVDFNGKKYYVTSIGDYTFNCSSLTSVTIPNSVTSIGNGAFNNCSGLTSISLPNSLTSIGNKAFYQCSNLTSIAIPNSVMSIGDDTFYACYELAIASIGNKVKSIGNNAFRGCNNLISVEIGDNVTSIGNYAFEWCGMTSITLPSSLKTIGENAFKDCDYLTSVKIPNNVTSIGEHAFSGCYSLSSVTIGNSVTSIGEYAFSGCSLTSVHISDLEAWYNIDFYDYTSNPVYFAKHLFLNGEEVKELVIPSYLTGIKKYTFEGCTGLTSVTIPNSITSIEEGAFSGCSGLTSVHISDLETWCKIDFGNYWSNPLYSAKHLFVNGKEVKNLVIPNSITTIKAFSFTNCDGFTTITIPNSVTSIGDYAFAQCRGLTDVYCLPEKVPELGTNVFKQFANVNLHVPKASLYDYFYIEPWKNFKWIETYVKGDAYMDKKLNEKDVKEMVNYIMGKPSKNFHIMDADMTSDGEVNATDIVQIINVIKEKE